MKIKPWNEYSVSEKKILLNFWFGNNGYQDMITKEDREQFKRLLEKDIDSMMDFVVHLVTTGRNSETLILLMRNGSLDELLEHVSRMDDDEDYSFIKNQVIAMLVGLCNITMATTDRETIIADAIGLAAEIRKGIEKRFS